MIRRRRLELVDRLDRLEAKYRRLRRRVRELEQVPELSAELPARPEPVTVELAPAPLVPGPLFPMLPADGDEDEGWSAGGYL